MNKQVSVAYCGFGGSDSSDSDSDSDSESAKVAMLPGGLTEASPVVFELAPQHGALQLLA